MNRPQWIMAGAALLFVVGLYAATANKIFGEHAPHSAAATQDDAHAAGVISIDTILFHARERLPAEQLTRLNFLEQSITRGDIKEQRLHLYHQLARFWADSARAFAPFAWYTAEAARLENSEKSLTFAAHLLLNNLAEETIPQIRQWEAVQARDLFERSLKLNPDNDSSRTGLGAVYVYGGIGTPMEGIGKIREVVQRDSNNIFAQWTLGQASLASGQLDKAAERFKKVAVLQPQNLEAVLLVAEVAEQMGNKAEAIEWYGKLLPSINNAAMKKEVQARIAKLKK